MRECRITRAELAAWTGGAPVTLIAKLKAAGFVFDSEACPITIARPYTVTGDPENGDLIYQQDDGAGGAAC